MRFHFWQNEIVSVRFLVNLLWLFTWNTPKMEFIAANLTISVMQTLAQYEIIWKKHLRMRIFHKNKDRRLKDQKWFPFHIARNEISCKHNFLHDEMMKKHAIGFASPIINVIIELLELVILPGKWVMIKPISYFTVYDFTT